MLIRCKIIQELFSKTYLTYLTYLTTIHFTRDRYIYSYLILSHSAELYANENAARPIVALARELGFKRDD